MGQKRPKARSWAVTWGGTLGSTAAAYKVTAADAIASRASMDPCNSTRTRSHISVESSQGKWHSPGEQAGRLAETVQVSLGSYISMTAWFQSRSKPNFRCYRHCCLASGYCGRASVDIHAARLLEMNVEAVGAAIHSWASIAVRRYKDWSAGFAHKNACY